MEIHPEILLTDDGSPTLHHPILNDCYHSTRGATGESSYVFIEQGFRWLSQQKEDAENQSPLRIFEVGFGSGLNALLTAVEAESLALPVEYHAIELYPISGEVIANLGYGHSELFNAIHHAPWGELSRITDFLSLKKNEASLPEYNFDTTFDLIYFDAFAPDTQPELWSETIFRKLWDALTDHGVVVTYSAKGSVKENLRAAGFSIQRLPGALGKRHMLRATKK